MIYTVPSRGLLENVDLYILYIDISCLTIYTNTKAMGGGGGGKMFSAQYMYTHRHSVDVLTRTQ
jgi:hypothetical protein